MKKIIITQTPYQVIVALYIKEQFCKKEDRVDLIITDTFNNYENITQKIKEKHIFNNIYIVKIKNTLLPIVKQKNLDFKYYFTNLKKLYYILRPKYMLKKTIGNIELYDEMYCWNYDAFSASIRSYHAMHKKPMKIYLFEEAYISYFPIEEVIPKQGFMKLIEIRNKFMNISDITRENIDGLILFEPKYLIYKPKCPIYKIDKKIGESKEFIDLIDYIFNARESAKKYDKKYIIFEEARIANQPEIDDEKLFNNIAKIVGKENVLIKLHPRTKSNRFKSKGIKTLDNDGVPWEAIACVGDFSDKVFISIASSSITTYKTFFNKKMKAYMLFKFLKPDILAFEDKYNDYWNKLGKIDKNGGIYMPKTEEEFFDMLRKESD